MKKSNRALKEKRDDIGSMAMLIQTLSAKLGIATGMGDGREKKGDPIDYSVGIVHHAKVGDEVTQGDPLLTIYANSADTLDRCPRAPGDSHRLE